MKDTTPKEGSKASYPLPVANSILQSWDSSSPVFRNVSAWMTMLRIVAAGEEGISRHDIIRGAEKKTKLCYQTECRWIEAGLITAVATKGRGTPSRRYFATDKAKALMRVRVSVPICEGRQQILDWLANGWVGQSSKTMAFIALGVKIKEINYPHDPDDLNRCLLLIQAAPCVKAAFPAIAESCPEWARLIARWDELEALFIAEVGKNWSSGRRANKTFALMQEILQPSK